MLSCRRDQTGPAGDVRPEPRAPSLPAPAPARTALEPLGGEWLQALTDIEGHGLGSISIPVGARERRRIVVAVHGAASRPDWMCSAVRASVGPEPFIVCPHPVSRFAAEASWSTAAQLRERTDAALEAAAQRFPRHLDSSRPVYIGHSQGAMIAPDALARAGMARFPYAIFFEGLPPDAPRAKRAVVTAGLERLSLISGQSGWKKAHAEFAKSLRDTPVASNHVHADVGHFLNGDAHRLIGDELTWLVGDRTGWACGAPEPRD